MTFSKALLSSNKMDWSTPQTLFDQFNEEFDPISLDVAAWDWNAKCPVWLTPLDDALSLDWSRVCHDVLGVKPLVWCNPPYGRQISKWVEKMRLEAVDNSSATVALLPARTGPGWFHKHIWDKTNQRPWWWVSDFRLLSGRLKFEGATNIAPLSISVA